jgi:sn-glycerol 3-phosphate transport system substrate-binding protein
MSRRLVAVLAAAGLLAACASGESILNAGNNDPVPPSATVGGTPATAAPGETLPPPTTVLVTTTTTPLASLPPCPVDALPSSGGPVEITFWHAMANVAETTLQELTAKYNAEQDRVRVTLENQGGYNENIDKYVQSSQESRPELVQFPEYVVQQTADSGTVVPVGACIAASEFDTSPILDRVISAWATGGVQWSMPFNISNPVLYYNKKVFRDAGLDPELPPLSLDDLREYSQAIVDTGAAHEGIAFDSGADSGGGWFIEQWFAKAGELYADHGNGRIAPATRVLYDGPAGVELLSYVQSLINDGLAVTVGDNPGGQDALLRMANPAEGSAMGIATSAGIGTVLSVVDQGLIAGITGEDIGIGPMPGPDGAPGVLVGGASLYIVADKGDAQTAAAWDYIRFLVSAQSQSTWAAATGYVPIRSDALELDPLAETYTTDPRFKVPFDQLIGSTDDPAALGPVLGPQREVRTVTARAVAAIFNGADVQQSLTDAATQSNALIADYNARN